MERRVVGQLAMAHERQLIEQGSCVKLTVDENKAVGEGAGERKETISPIKLQLLKKGTFRDTYIDIDLTQKENPFTAD